MNSDANVCMEAAFTVLTYTMAKSERRRKCVKDVVCCTFLTHRLIAQVGHIDWW